MNISPWTIYWIMQLDSIGNALSLITFLAIMALFVLIMIIVVVSSGSDSDDEFDKKFVNNLKSIIKKLSPITLVLFLICVITPNSKTLATMIVIPAIANNEIIKEESVEIYNLAKEAMREMVNSKEKGK